MMSASLDNMPLKKNLKRNLPIISCECGKEILLTPNLELMSNLIEAHIAEHTSRESDPSRAEALASRLRDRLIAQVFDRIDKDKRWTISMHK